VCRVVAHPELPLDHRRHPRGGPDVADKAVGLRPAGQEVGDPRSLLGRQLGRRPEPDAGAQRRDAARSGAREPLADRPGA
jgi:hypothetical protein